MAFTLACALAGGVTPLPAQESALVEILTPVLAAEDARAWRPEELRAALVYPDSFVRRTGAIAIGRIGDARGVELLVPLLADPDTTVRVAAVFALGLIGDTSAVRPIVERLEAPPVLDVASAGEAVTALARIGGPRAAEVIAAILQGRASLAVDDPGALVPVAAQESWRLGEAAPVAELLPLIRAENDELRTRAVFALSRLRPPGAANALGDALNDPVAAVRSYAVRGFNRRFAETSRLGPDGAAALIARLVDDPDAGVRIGALRALAALDTGRFVAQVLPRLDDGNLNVRVQAASTLGDIGGAEASAALERVFGSRTAFAVQREALLGLSRSDTAAFRRAARAWEGSPRWQERAVVAAGSGALGGRPMLLDDRDPRVVAAALGAWIEGAPGRSEAGRRFITQADVAVRAIAAGIIGEAPTAADIPLLSAAYERAARDTAPDAALAALEGLLAIARSTDGGAARVESEFVQRAATPRNYVIRRWAEERWPSLTRRWGPAYPLTPSRTVQDYRELVRRFIVAPDSVRRPHVVLELERGSVEIELLGPDAPMTVANFLSLVDRGVLNGSRWHRVVPDFVVQGGDPRGDGWGAAGPPVRDEINRERYLLGTVGMALSGPDTGTSQFFITLGPQPHLDGTYTVFGRVVGSYASLMRITQGDVIRNTRR
ncbi:MAG TPA: peptidylprolyl isomerase [Gemmatimonadales bacterium]|nr:peptidylprolyl isomerase [Gemmatimonadales bacterium]